MTTQATRFHLVDVAVLKPGVDFVTKSPSGPFIDTGYTLDFSEWKSGSRVYLSVATVREMAQNAGLFDGLTSEQTIARDVEIYNRGYQDAVKENIGGELRDIAERLGFVADRLGDLALDSQDEPTPDGDPDRESAAAVVAIESKRDGKSRTSVARAGATDGQGARARGNNRPAGVPSNTGDGTSFRI